ncbi:MAG: YARHG domain-containing protein [Butyrivibrio sp.]|nr:YARHG domain-containing protein [Butyrivibrio sp.]
MGVIKCKMCGGDIEVKSGESVLTCRYCGTLLTVPNIDSDRKARLFNKANDYRANCEFDKAYDAYRSIVEEDDKESEAYWGMILSEYGIEYVEEPGSRRRIPTCHRTRNQSVLNSSNYNLAIKYADAEQKLIYREEAEEIDRLQKEILSVSSKVEPYDVFICYKETDENGDRTTDSVLAQDIYDALTSKGLRTFFARISLEDMIGINYEPYIYAALSTAKVMVLVVDDVANCSSIWVQNEWMRFLKFRRESPDKTIIPAYRNISPSALPHELSKFQGQDMSKVGAVQDLVHSVKKCVEFSNEKNDVKKLLEQSENIINEKYSQNNKEKSRTSPIVYVLIGATIVIAAFLFIGMNADNGSDKDSANEIAEQTINNNEINTDVVVENDVVENVAETDNNTDEADYPNLDQFINLINSFSDPPELSGDELYDYYKQEYDIWRDGYGYEYIYTDNDGNFYMQDMTDYEDTYYQEESEYMLPGSDTQYISREYLETFSSDELRIARNEIYARYGRMFKDETLQEYFNSKSWYYPQYTADEFDPYQEQIFNEYEKANIQTIKEIEAERQ